MIDTHTHLTDDPLNSRLPEVLEKARADGVTGFIIPGYDKDSWKNAKKLSELNRDIFFAVGLHPLFINGYTVEKLEKELDITGSIAIGEIGLDYTKITSPAAVAAPPSKGDFVDCKKESVEWYSQKMLFEFQMSVARDNKLPVIIHCRKAYNDLLEILKKFPEVRGVLHSCSCSHEQIKPFLDFGYYVGFSGVVTRKQTKKNKKLAEFVPLERILVETDSPFIGTDNYPVPAAEPFCVREVISALAEIKQMSFEEVERITTKNAKELFGI